MSARTGDIGLISVVGEAGVASGVRRIEALTAKAARDNANNFTRLAKAIGVRIARAGGRRCRAGVDGVAG